MSFFYCALPKFVAVRPWKFTLFTEPFDLWTWILLSISFAIVFSLLSTKWFTNKEFSRRSMFMLLFSGTLQLGTQSLPTHSHIFMLWLATSMVCVCYYTGEITSEVISPPRDDVITTFTELEKNNLTLCNINPIRRQTLLSTALSLNPSSRLRKSILYHLESGISGDFSLNIEKNKEFYFGGRWFTVPWWQVSLLYSKYLLRLLTAKGATETQKRTRCHVGQELIRVDEEFVAFLPPGNLELMEAYKKLVEAGIVSRFLDENDDMMSSERVQDRSQRIGRTKVRKIFEAQDTTLSLQSKLRTVFLFWVVCIICCVVGFLCELMMSVRSKVTGLFMSVSIVAASLLLKLLYALKTKFASYLHRIKI